MPTTTPSFGWPVPVSSDLVKDGATAIESLGDAIDASMTDLKGGTTGQVLAKASNTDMDFSWVAQDDSNAIQNSIVDAKGDIITATANDTPARLAVGANNTVLTADSSTATGLKWAAAAGGGKVLQVVEGTTTSYSTNSTTTYADTNLSATITPSATTSKILVIVAQAGCGHDANNGGAYYRLVRGSTAIATVGDGIYGYSSVNVNGRRGYSLAITCLDSPSTTSATTYKTQFANDGAGFSIVQDYISTAATRSSIILMEIGA
jgi:hypothetical protein